MINETTTRLDTTSRCDLAMKLTLRQGGEGDYLKKRFDEYEYTQSVIGFLIAEGMDREYITLICAKNNIFDGLSGV